LFTHWAIFDLRSCFLNLNNTTSGGINIQSSTLPGESQLLFFYSLYKRKTVQQAENSCWNNYRAMVYVFKSIKKRW